MARRTVMTCDRCGAEMLLPDPSRLIKVPFNGVSQVINSIDFTFNTPPFHGETNKEYNPDLCPDCLQFFLEELGFKICPD